MKSILYKLTDKITLLENTEEISGTEVPKYRELINTRGVLRLLKSDNLTETFELITLKLPAKLKNSQISGVKWRNKEYACDSDFSEYKERFIKGRVIRHKI